MQSLLKHDTLAEIIDRLDQLNENSERLWGKMTVGQMCWHCQYPLKLGITNKENTSRGNWFIKLFFKKSLYNNKPWRRNLPTSPQLKAREPKNFKEERDKLKSLINEFHSLQGREEWHPHPSFGTFTKEQWGQLQYKHLNHHLTQFGV